MIISETFISKKLSIEEISQREASWLLQAVIHRVIVKGMTGELLEALLGHRNIDSHWEDGNRTK